MKKSAAGIYFLLFCTSLISHAEDSVQEETAISFSIDVGESKYGKEIYRFGLQKSLDRWFARKKITLAGYIESSINVWEGSTDTVFAVAISPVFRTTLFSVGQHQINLEAGIGVALISKIKIDDRDLSSSFQFEDRIGFQYKTNNMDIHIRYMHYSNAGLSQPNNGIDIYIIGAIFKW